MIFDHVEYMFPSLRTLRGTFVIFALLLKSKGLCVKYGLNQELVYENLHFISTFSESGCFFHLVTNLPGWKNPGIQKNGSSCCFISLLGSCYFHFRICFALLLMIPLHVGIPTHPVEIFFLSSWISRGLGCFIWMPCCWSRDWCIKRSIGALGCCWC